MLYSYLLSSSVGDVKGDMIFGYSVFLYNQLKRIIWFGVMTKKSGSLHMVVAYTKARTLQATKLYSIPCTKR